MSIVFNLKTTTQEVVCLGFFLQIFFLQRFCCIQFYKCPIETWEIHLFTKRKISWDQHHRLQVALDIYGSSRPFTFNEAPGNIQGNIARYDTYIGHSISPIIALWSLHCGSSICGCMTRVYIVPQFYVLDTQLELYARCLLLMTVALEHPSRMGLQGEDSPYTHLGPDST